jgi:hypothetical protein
MAQGLQGIALLESAANSPQFPWVFLLGGNVEQEG